MYSNTSHDPVVTKLFYQFLPVGFLHLKYSLNKYLLRIIFLLCVIETQNFHNKKQYFIELYGIFLLIRRAWYYVTQKYSIYTQKIAQMTCVLTVQQLLIDDKMT